MASSQIPKFVSMFIWMILASLRLVNSANTTSSSTVVPAMAISRLPSYEVVESNLTDTPAPAVDTAKIMANLTESAKKPVELVEFRDSSTEGKLPSTANRSVLNYQPSSSTTRASYVNIGNIGEGKKKIAFSYSSNHEHSLESGFQPIVPPLFLPDAIEKPYTATEGLVDATFKTSLPTRYEPYQSTGGFGSYPTYGEVQSANYYDPLKFEDEKVHLTTYATPPVNPMQRPLVYKPRKNYPTKSHPHPFLKAPPYDDHFGNHHLESEFDGLASYENFHENYNLFEKPNFKDKPYKKNGLLQILTTLIPIGLLLSALPPRVIFINSTNPVHPVHKPFFRHIEKELSQMSPYDTAYNLVTNLGLAPSTNAACNKRKICEVASNGTKPEHSFVENSLWHLLSRSSDVIRKNLNLQDVFEAVIREECSQFSCSGDIRAGKVGADEARQNDRSAQQIGSEDQNGDRPRIPAREDLSKSNR